MRVFNVRLTAVCLLVVSQILTACSKGANSGVDAAAKADALPSCDPSSGLSGSSVTISVAGHKKIQDDSCTVKFDGVPGKNTVYDAQAQTFKTFAPPAGPGAKEVSVQCGVDDPVLLCSFEIIKPEAAPSHSDGQPEAAPSAPAPECLADTDCLGGKVCQGGSCVEPVAPGPVVPAGPTDADGDGVVDTADACPGTPAGSTVDATGCVPPPPPATAAFINAGPNATARVVSSTVRFNTIRLNYKIENAEEAYIYGPFNRTSTDADCQLAGSRYLVTTYVGNEVDSTMPGWVSDYQKYSVGEKCDAASGNCKNYLPVAGEGLICKIDLKAAGLAGVFYTKLLVPHGKFVLAAKGKDGVWVFDDQSFDIPPPSIDNIDIHLTNDRQPKVSLSFDYQYSLFNLSLGCATTEGPAPVPPLGGEGFYSRSACEFNPSSPQQFTLLAVGVGNADVAVYRFVCGDLQAKLQEGSYYQNESGDEHQFDSELPGYVSMTGTAYRTCHLERKDGSVFHTVSGSLVTIAGFKKMTFFPASLGGLGAIAMKSYEISDSDVKIESGKGKVEAIRMRRNYNSTEWILTIEDIDGSKVTAPERIIKHFDARFEVIPDTWWGSCYGSNHHSCRYVGFSGCNSDVTWDNECWYTYDHTDYGIRFQARHIKEIQVTCPDGLDHDVSYDASDEASYQWQYFEVRGSRSNTDIECTFRAIGYDGNEVATHRPVWTCGGSTGKHGC